MYDVSVYVAFKLSDQGFVGLESQEEPTCTSKIILNLLANGGCLLYRNVSTTMDFGKGS